MRQKNVYIEIAQRYIASAKQHLSQGINVQEVVGFLAYHALESIGSAVIVHFNSSMPINHETKLKMFLRFCKRNLADLVNVRSIAAIVIRVEKSGYRSKFLYPDLIAENNYKAPKDQITIIDARLLIQDVDRIINQIIDVI